MGSEGGGWKNLYILLLWGGGLNPFLRNIFRSIFYITNRAVKWFGIWMSCFSVNYAFLTTFYYVEKLSGILRKNREEGFKKSYVINEWPLFFKNIYISRSSSLSFWVRNILALSPMTFGFHFTTGLLTDMQCIWTAKENTLTQWKSRNYMKR